MSTIPIQNLIVDNDTYIGLTSDLINGVIHGMGLPFERLYFEARKHLICAMNALMHLQAERVANYFKEFVLAGPPPPWPLPSSPPISALQSIGSFAAAVTQLPPPQQLPWQQWWRQQW
jgi:hypothetical protein